MLKDLFYCSDNEDLVQSVAIGKNEKNKHRYKLRRNKLPSNVAGLADVFVVWI